VLSRSPARTGHFFICVSVRCVTFSAVIMISALCGDFTERCMVVPYGRCGTTYRAYLQGPSSPRRMVTCPVRMGPMGFSDTSVRIYHTSLRKIPKCAYLYQISKHMTSCRSWLWQLTVAVWSEHSCWNWGAVKIRIGLLCINRTVCHTRTAGDTDALNKVIHLLVCRLLQAFRRHLLPPSAV